MSRIGALGVHDVGGEVRSHSENSGQIDKCEVTLPHWAKSIHSLVNILASKSPPMLTADELRRAVEGLEADIYKSWGYYDRWAAAITNILLERKLIDESVFIREVEGDSYVSCHTSIPIAFKEGDMVQVRAETHKVRWRRPHLRCPGYIFGSIGKISKVVGHFEDPSLSAFRGVGPSQPLYSVVFILNQIWSNGDVNSYASASHETVTGTDTVEIDIFQDWLLPYTSDDLNEVAVNKVDSLCMSHTHSDDHSCDTGHDHNRKRSRDDYTPPAAASDDPHHHMPTHDLNHNHEHDSGHSHSHEGGHHEDRHAVETTAVEREGEQPWPPGRVVAEALLRTVCGEQVSSDAGSKHNDENNDIKNNKVDNSSAMNPSDSSRDSGSNDSSSGGSRSVLTSRAEIMRGIVKLDTLSKQLLGASLVAHAWKDAAYKARLINSDTTAAACAELNVNSSNPNAPTVLRVVENTSQLHNIVVCTLCSCYPIGLLGLSPSWYKSASYRARVVREPREVMKEFGTVLPADVKIMVHDSTANCRYLVLPLPPVHVDVNAYSEQELRHMVTRDSMIGVTIL